MATRGMPPISQLKSRPLGRILIKMGKLTRAQVSEALELQKKKRGPLGRLLVGDGRGPEAVKAYAELLDVLERRALPPAREAFE